MTDLHDHMALVKSTLGNLAGELLIENGAVLAYVEPASIRDALERLQEGSDTLMDVMSFMTAVDYQPREPRFEVVYELFSTATHQRVRVKCRLEDTGREDVLPEIDTDSDIFLTANWHERECFDLMGIHFRGHPDLRRILLPEQWDGHPLRKEYPYDGKRAWKPGTTVVTSARMEGDLGL